MQNTCWLMKFRAVIRIISLSVFTLVISCSDPGIPTAWCPCDESTYVYLSPETKLINDLSSFSEEIRIHNADSLVALYLEISYDSSLLHYDGICVESDQFGSFDLNK